MVVLAVITLLSMVACYFISRSRSTDYRFWVLMGLLFGPFAIPFALYAQPRAESEQE